MDDLLIQRRMRMPVVTGVPTSPEAVRSSQPQTGTSFRDVLEQEAQKTTELSFSRHAAGRVAERGIEISRTGMERLEEGLRMAREKGLNDTLILMDGSAFIVSAQNGTVITAMPSQELNGRVFTNIDGTVIL
ncbi:MAG: TIGR02530 family flagellar biosynthesis protein [Acutalibacteraceae bacterium]|nr:flagellar protein [Clostridiales bacterium]